MVAPSIILGLPGKKLEIHVTISSESIDLSGIISPYSWSRKNMEDCHVEYIPSSCVRDKHTSFYRSGIEIVGNNNFTGGVPDFVLKGIHHPTVVSDRIVRR